DLGRRGLVFGRHAAHRIGDARIDEREPIIRRGQVAAAGKAETFERVVEEAAGKIAGKRPSRTVRAPQAGGQTDDQEPRAARTERGDRRVEPAGLAAAPLLAERFEARAERAVAAGLAGRVGIAAFNLRSRRHRGARRRPPAAAPSNAAGIAAYGARAARALRAPHARPGRGRSWAAARRYRGRCRLGGATRRRPSAAAWRWWRPRSRARRAAAPPRPASGSRPRPGTAPSGPSRPP